VVDHIEALVALDRLVEAEAIIRVVEERSRRLDRPSGLNAAARGRGLLLALGGDADKAARSFTEAITVIADVPLPFDEARTHLDCGLALRRLKARRGAQQALESASTLFEQLGARHWLARTRRELDRVGRRTQMPLELTLTERRIAELAATGASTRDIAAAAFISPKTVEANITRIYRKLGVSSRAQLAVLMVRDAKV
jgi:DNA-binding CsgD family transcriptional regulator